jgi:hypothetical protein
VLDPADAARGRTSFVFAIALEISGFEIDEADQIMQKASDVNWRMGWDSNPREVALCRFSRPVPSTARPPIRLLPPGSI